MALSTRLLLNKLRQENFSFQFFGYEYGQIYMVQTAEPGVSFQQGIFYISPDSNLPHILDNPNLCLLITDKKFCKGIYCRAREILTSHYKKETLLTEICQNIIQGASLDMTLPLCTALMSNPVIVIDKALRPITPLPQDLPAEEEFLNVLSDAVQNAQEHAVSIIDMDSAYSSKIILGTTLAGKFLIVFEHTNTFDIEYDLYYVEKLCRILSDNASRTRQNTGEDSSTLTYLIRGLFQKVPGNPDITRKHLKSLGWKEYEQYYVLSIDKYQKDFLTINYLEELRSILYMNLYEYEHYIIAILGCGRYEQFSVQKYPRLTEYLKKHNLQAGLSHGFFDITNLFHFLEQSIKATEFNKYFHFDGLIVRFEDFETTYLLEICSKHSDINFLNLCLSSTVAIYEYDKVHHTEYLNTLAAYILSDFSPRKAAQILYIHPNTMYNRINKLKDFFGINFDDLGMISKLNISINIFGYLNIIDAHIWEQLFRLDSRFGREIES